MTIVAFLETPTFPEIVGFWAIGGPQFKTRLATVLSGREKVNINWSQARGAWNIANGLRELQHAELTLDFFCNAYGMGGSFRFKDFRNYQTTITTGILGTGVGSASTSYQMFKRFIIGANSYDHKIVKPTVTPAPQIFKDSVLQTLTTHYTVDTTTGIVTFVSAPNGNVIRWVGDFDFPVRFDTDLAEIGTDPGGLLIWNNVMLIEKKL